MRLLLDLPTLRELTAQLRRLHEAFAHPAGGSEYARLACVDADGRGVTWQLLAAGQLDNVPVACTDDGDALVFGCELVPGDGAPFDAVAAARRLLAAARTGIDGRYSW